jgi:hypothetical protein
MLIEIKPRGAPGAGIVAAFAEAWRVRLTILEFMK